MPPPSTAQGLHNLLSSLRAPIFHTQYNPTNARLGTKHLRRAVRAPPRQNWYLTPLNYRRLNGIVSYSNTFANQRGLGAIEGKGWGAQPVDYSRKKSHVPSRTAGEREIKRRLGAGWLFNLKENRRMTYILKRKKVGKGTPKKGFGKGAQLKGKVSAKK